PRSTSARRCPMRTSTSNRRRGSPTSSPDRCARSRPTTLRSCCDRRSTPTNGCCSSTAQCSASALASSTSGSSEFEMSADLDADGRAGENGDRDPVVHTRPGATAEELRARGAQLLSDSADVWFEDDTHPAYARILEELSPDEARILRFLAIEGPQPAVDVRT